MSKSYLVLMPLQGTVYKLFSYVDNFILWYITAKTAIKSKTLFQKEQNAIWECFDNINLNTKSRPKRPHHTS